ncbi:class I SAM-dependent methyltransferase [Kitasatospora sp. NPDC053057]|uniref:class I SAM-dependent methyltransferase n=1 Tax=Kitasatospora sp. NPDC053057 TaxID=3364062 RepID=UPI0037C8EE7D
MRSPTTELPDEGFDFACSVTAVHHLDFTAALARMRELLCPGGVLVVVGPAREETATGWARQVAAERVLPGARYRWHVQASATRTTQPPERSVRETTICGRSLDIASQARTMARSRRSTSRSPDQVRARTSPPATRTLLRRAALTAPR